MLAESLEQMHYHKSRGNGSVDAETFIMVRVQLGHDAVSFVTLVFILLFCLHFNC